MSSSLKIRSELQSLFRLRSHARFAIVRRLELSMINPRDRRGKPRVRQGKRGIMLDRFAVVEAFGDAEIFE